MKYFGSVDNALDKIVIMDDKPMMVSAIAADPPLNSHIQFDILIPYKWLYVEAVQVWKEDIPKK